MITKENIDDAADNYLVLHAGSLMGRIAFVAGAEWAAEQMQAENAELRTALRAIFNAADADHSPVYAETLFAEISKAKTVLYK